MVFQSYALSLTMTVERNIAFGLENKRISKEEHRRRTREVSEIAGLTGYIRTESPPILAVQGLAGFSRFESGMCCGFVQGKHRISPHRGNPVYSPAIPAMRAKTLTSSRSAPLAIGPGAPENLNASNRSYFA